MQRRLREITQILNRVLPWARSELAAYAWYRLQPLPSFGDMTAEELVRQDRANDVRAYLPGCSRRLRVTLPLRRFTGIVHRAHHPRWAFSLESGEGARLHGGRFNRPGVAAL